MFYSYGFPRFHIVASCWMADSPFNCGSLVGSFSCLFFFKPPFLQQSRSNISLTTCDSTVNASTCRLPCLELHLSVGLSILMQPVLLPNFYRLWNQHMHWMWMALNAHIAMKFINFMILVLKTRKA
jgi:hypothetical protein